MRHRDDLVKLFYIVHEAVQKRNQDILKVQLSFLRGKLQKTRRVDEVDRRVRRVNKLADFRNLSERERERVDLGGWINAGGLYNAICLMVKKTRMRQ